MNRSTADMLNLSAIPAELKKIPRWLVWRSERDDITDRIRKIPYQAKCTYRRASSTDEDTWSSFDDAVSALSHDVEDRTTYRLVKRRRFAGLGFCFDGDGICGLDLDGALDKNGNLDPLFEPILKGFAGTFVERSPSREGLHIIIRCEGQPFRTGHSKGWKAGSKKEVALYFDGRYFTFTGDVYAGSEIKTFSKDHIRSVLAPWIHDPEPVVIMGCNSPLQQLDDQDIVSLASDAKNGPKFDSLYRLAAWEGVYDSQSEADNALASLLAFWTRDAEQIERIMRHSALARDKWSRPGYLTRTIRRAINGSIESYGSWHREKVRRGQKILSEVWRI